MDITVIVEAIIKLSIAIFIGYIAAKTKYVPSSARETISKLIMKITLPLLILTSLLSKDFSPDTAKNCLIVVAVGIVVMAVLFLIGWLTAKLFRLPKATQAVHAVMTASGNIVFLGYPVLSAVYGAEGLLYAVVYGITNDFLLWSVGVYSIYKASSGESPKSALKKLINTNTITIAIAIPLMLIGFKLPPVINDALTNIGGLTTYLSMLFIGFTLAEIKIHQIYKRFSMFAVIIIKMLIAPVVVVMILKGMELGHVVCGAIALELAMPAQTIMSIMVHDAKSDINYVTEYIFISTIISLLTLPLVYYFVEKIMGL